jgi:hypothetical protein
MTFFIFLEILTFALTALPHFAQVINLTERKYFDLQHEY